MGTSGCWSFPSSLPHQTHPQDQSTHVPAGASSLPVADYPHHPSQCMRSGCCGPAHPTLYSWMRPQVLQPGPAQPVLNLITHECWRVPWLCLTQPVTTPSSQENQLKLQITRVGPYIFHKICSPDPVLSHAGYAKAQHNIPIPAPTVMGGFCDLAPPDRPPAKALLCTIE